MEKQDVGAWQVTGKDLEQDKKIELEADFVFIGAGGGALHLLEKSNIEEAEGYGGFPISGQWLVCDNVNRPIGGWSGKTVSHQRPVAGVRQPRRRRTPCGKGVRKSQRRGATHVGATPGYPHH